MIQKQPYQTKTQKSHKDLRKAFRKLFVDPEIGVRIRSKFAHFVGSEGLGADIDSMWDQSRLSPIDWWNYSGGELPHIQNWPSESCHRLLVPFQ